MNMMMETAPMADMMSGMDMTAMQNLVEASAACEQACMMCSSSCMGMAGMEMCASMCMNMADMSNTMMHMMMRPAAMMDPTSMDAMTTMMRACMMMAEACEAECMKHMDMGGDMMQMCATACREMAMACEAMMASMKAMN